MTFYNSHPISHRLMTNNCTASKPCLLSVVPLEKLLSHPWPVHPASLPREWENGRLVPSTGQLFPFSVWDFVSMHTEVSAIEPVVSRFMLPIVCLNIFITVWIFGEWILL